MQKFLMATAGQAFPLVPLSNATRGKFSAAWPGNLALACSASSVVGSLLIILTYLAFHDIRSTSRQILAYLSLANLLASASIVWGVSANLQDSDSVSCQVQSVLLIANGIADFMWNIALALYLFVIITREGSRWGSNGCPLILYVACWAPGILVALVTYLERQTGVDEGAINTAKWCIVRGPQRSDKHSTDTYAAWSMIVGDAWNILAIFTTISLYIPTKIHLYRETHQRQSTFLTRGALNAAHHIDQKLTFVPLTYFFLHIWSFIRTILALTRSDINADIDTVWFKCLLALQTFGDCSEGLANAIIFLVFSPKLRQRLKAAFLAKLFFMCYLCKTKCCHAPVHQDDAALQRAAGGNYAQGAVNEASQSHVHAPRPLSSYHWNNTGTASSAAATSASGVGRTSPYSISSNNTSARMSERTQLSPPARRGLV